MADEQKLRTVPWNRDYLLTLNNGVQHIRLTYQLREGLPKHCIRVHLPGGVVEGYAWLMRQYRAGRLYLPLRWRVTYADGATSHEPQERGVSQWGVLR